MSIRGRIEALAYRLAPRSSDAAGDHRNAAAYRAHALAALRAIGGEAPPPPPLSPAVVAWLDRQAKASRVDAIVALERIVGLPAVDAGDTTPAGGES